MAKTRKFSKRQIAIQVLANDIHLDVKDVLDTLRDMYGLKGKQADDTYQEIVELADRVIEFIRGLENDNTA